MVWPAHMHMLNTNKSIWQACSCFNLLFKISILWLCLSDMGVMVSHRLKFCICLFVVHLVFYKPKVHEGVLESPIIFLSVPFYLFISNVASTCEEVQIGRWPCSVHTYTKSWQTQGTLTNTDVDPCLSIFFLFSFCFLFSLRSMYLC